METTKSREPRVYDLQAVLDKHLPFIKEEALSEVLKRKRDKCASVDDLYDQIAKEALRDLKASIDDWVEFHMIVGEIGKHVAVNVTDDSGTITVTVSQQKPPAPEPFFAYGFDIPPSPIFQGFTRGELWNGWHCPRFPKESADQIVKWANEEGGGARFDEASDSYLFEDPNDDFEPEPYKGIDIEVNGEEIHVYPIGAWCWIWH